MQSRLSDSATAKCLRAFFPFFSERIRFARPNAIALEQPPQNSPTRFLRFAANGFRPLAFQFLETTPWMMPKPIKDLESALRFEKARVLATKLGLVEVLKSFQRLFE